jgi:hypothetical protein
LKNVLIFAYECAPFHRPESTIGAQRPAQFAKYLPDYGWRAVVLCCDHRRRRLGRPEDIAKETLAAVETLRRAEPTKSVVLPLPSLPFDGLLDECWVRLASGEMVDSGYRPLRLPVRVRSALRKPLTVLKTFSGDHSQSWQPFARSVASALRSVVRFDAALGEHGPDAGLFLGRWFSRRFGVPWVADFRDPVLVPIHPMLRPPHRQYLRHFLLADVSEAVNVNAHWCDLDRRWLGVRSTEIPNGYDPSEFGLLSTRSRSDALFTVAYFGQVASPKQDMGIFLSGLSMFARATRERAGRIRFLYRGVSHRLVDDLVRLHGVQRFCDVAGAIPRDEALVAMQEADALLILTGRVPGDPFYDRGVVPGKFFEYLGAGRPILVVPGDNGVVDALLDETRSGVILSCALEVRDTLLASVGAIAGPASLPVVDDETKRKHTRAARAAELARVLSRASAPTKKRGTLVAI